MQVLSTRVVPLLQDPAQQRAKNVSEYKTLQIMPMVGAQL